MAGSTELDRRLREREIRKGTAGADRYRTDESGLPDLAERAEFPGDEDVGHLAEELEAEKVARDLRIERALAEPARVEKPVVPLTPLDLE